MPKITVTTYNAQEAAAVIGVTRITIWRAMRDGKLVGHHVGNRVVILPEDLLEYVLRYQRGKGIPATT